MLCGTWDNWCKSYTFVVARPLDYEVHIVANYLLLVTEKGVRPNPLAMGMKKKICLHVNGGGTGEL